MHRGRNLNTAALIDIQYCYKITQKGARYEREFLSLRCSVLRQSLGRLMVVKMCIFEAIRPCVAVK
jgi:hypothetical protein